MRKDKLVACILIAMLNLYTTGGSSSRFTPRSRSRYNETSLPLEGFDRRSTTVDIEKYPQYPSCTESEYNFTYLCHHGRAMALTCVFEAQQRDLTYQRAQEECVAYEMTLAKINDIRDFTEALLVPFTNPTPFWIGLRRSQDNEFRWEKDGSLVTWSKWADNQPDSSYGHDDCVTMTSTGWDDKGCNARRHFICADANQSPKVSTYRMIHLETSVEPAGRPDLRTGENVTVTCTSYKFRFETFHLQVKYQPGSEAEFTESGNDCAPPACVKHLEYTFHRNRGKCVRKAVWTFLFPMSQNLHGAEWTCRLWDMLAFHDSPMVRGHFLYFANQRPVLNVNNNEVSDTTVLLWTCENTLGSYEIASTALISYYRCGSWMVTAMMNGDKVENNTVLDCVDSTYVEITPRSRTELKNKMTIRVNMTVTGDLEGAIIACFSYDARPKWSNGTLLDLDDPFAAYSEPLKVIDYIPREPRLTVNYHVQPSTVYRNIELTAFCDANVGDGGNLLWTLKTETGETLFSSSASTPDIRIDTHPNTRSCPDGWRRNLVHETCMKKLDVPYSWEDARSQCQKQGSDLAQVFAYYGHLYLITNIISEDGYWIGLNDLDGDGKLTWWSSVDREVTIDEIDWVTMVDRDVELGWPLCVCLYKKALYKHGCVSKLMAVCEIPPPPGVPLYGEFQNIEIGSKMRSKITIKIQGSMQGATLACQVTGPTIDDEDSFKKESLPFTIVYGNAEPQYLTQWETKGDTYNAHIRCSAHVGTGGELSIAIYSKALIKYLYIADLTGEIRSVTEAPKLKNLKVTVTDSEKDGPAIAVEATLVPTEKLLNPYAMCFSNNINVDDKFHFEKGVIAMKNVEYSKNPEEFDVKPYILVGSLLPLALLLALFTISRGKKKAVAAEGMVSDTMLSDLTPTSPVPKEEPEDIELQPNESSDKPMDEGNEPSESALDEAD